MALGLASTYEHMEKVLGYVTGENMKLNDIKVDLDANIKRVYWRYTLVEWLAGGQHP
jgi:hypothetical protein